MQQTRQLVILLSLPLLIFFACQNSTQPASDSSTNEITKMKKSTLKERLVRHMVLFKFKKESKAEDINQLNEAFNALPAAIPVIKDFEWGLNHSPEKLDQGFTHCYMLTFKSEEDRDSIYAPHPAHQAFVKSLGPHVDGVFVVDYWTNP